MNRKNFKAQALALVMVVLVVASIIGVSLFSRMSKDKQASIDQQESSISLTQVDSILDFFVGADIELIETVLGESTESTLQANDVGEISGLLQSVGISEEVISLDDEPWCKGESDVYTSLQFSENSDFIEFQPGSVAAINLIDGNVTATPCALRVRLKAMESLAVFVIKRVYDDGTTVSEEVSNYCIQTGTEENCPSDIDGLDHTGSLSYLNDGVNQYGWDSVNSTAYIDIDLKEEIDTNHTAEIRILPIKGVLGVNYELQEENCIENKQFNAIKITAEATCNDSYRGKQMFLPGSGTLGYSALFDYGIYDNGLFQP